MRILSWATDCSNAANVASTLAVIASGIVMGIPGASDLLSIASISPIKDARSWTQSGNPRSGGDDPKPVSAAGMKQSSGQAALTNLAAEYHRQK